MYSVRILGWKLAFATLSIKKRKIVEFKGILLQTGEVMKSLKDGGNYLYLGSLQANEVKNTKMKIKVKEEYFRRVRKIL